MSTVVDLGPLVALEAQAAAEQAADAAPAVGIPASDIPAKTAEQDVPELDKAVEADAAEEKEVKPEDKAKADDKPEAKIATKPEVLAQSIHEALKAFLGEKPTADGIAKLKEINTMTGELYRAYHEALGASKDVA